MSRNGSFGSDLVEEIASGLQEELGPPYRIISQPRYDDSLSLRGSPDLVVMDGDTGRITLIEVKVSPPDDELPLATLPQMRRLKDHNRELNASVILVSTSEVPEAVAQSLATHDIGVVRGRSRAEILPGLRELIAGTPATAE
jgi:hypothetical protein